MKLKFLLLTLLTVAMGFAQEKATITGKVTDKDMNGESLPFASVAIKGTSIGTNTDETGTYTLSVPAGEQTVVFTFLGYETKEVAVTLAAGETKTIDEVLGSTSVKLEDVVIETVVNREKETTLLLEQKNAMEMKQAIGAQEIARKGINDAAGAVLKTSGIAKQEGINNVFVRGLGDRYNSTTLNGLPLPSEDPVYKNISLEFFGSNIIKSININKTFGAGLYGDVAGANIDIASKELDTKSIFAITAKTGVNTNAIGESNFAVADGAYNYFGSLKDGRNFPISNLQQYDFKSNIKPTSVNSPVNSGFNVVGGHKFDFSGNRSLSLFGVANNTSNYSFQKGSLAQPTANTGFTQRDMSVQKYQYDASQTFLGNIKYRFEKGSVAVNSIYIHDNSQYVANYFGYDSGINGNQELPGSQKSIIVRQQNNVNNLFSNQALADYKFSDKLKATAGVVYSTIRGTEPDRKNNEYLYNDGTGTYQQSNDSPADNHRFFSTLDENDFGARAELNYTFNPEANNPTVLTVGGNYRDTDRTFNFIQYNFDFQNPVNVDPNHPDAVFNQQNLTLGQSNGGYDLITDQGNLKPLYYIGKRNIGAGFARIVHSFSEKLTAQVGVRYENLQQNVIWHTNISSSVGDATVKPSNIDKNYLLPSLNLKYNFTEKHVLRFAASETYTVPQFKEVAPFNYVDINSSEYGNPYLKPSTAYNIDLKYDFYPSKKELFSIGGYYKYIKDPISRVQVASAAVDYSYVNTEKAFVTGVEIEAKKMLYSVESDTRTNDLSLGLNASYLYSEQTQNDTSADELTVQFTHDKGKMQGATPLLINADLSYNTSTENTGLVSTLVLNYFHDQVYTVGTFGRENNIEKAIPTLDFVNRFDIKKYKLGISLSAMNILNPRYRVTLDTKDQANGAVTASPISSFRKGMSFSVGISWQLY